MIDPRIAQRQAQLEEAKATEAHRKAIEAAKAAASNPSNNYITASGSQGYVNAEQRRKQEQSKQPVSQAPTGSTGGGAVSYGNSSAASAAPVKAYNPYADMLAAIERQNAETRRMREEQLAQQKREAENRYNNRVNNINSGSDKMLREAYISMMQDKRQLPQNLKALGISGGASETTLQNMNANYANNRQEIEADRLAAIDEAAADRDALRTAAYNDFYNANINDMVSYNDKYNQITLAQAQAQAEADKAAASAAAKANTQSAYSAADVMKTAGYKYAADLLGAGNSSKQIYTIMKNAGYGDAQIAEYLYLMGF